MNSSDPASSSYSETQPTEGASRLDDADNPNVAIIAIHGVGQHLSGASADAVSTLLMSIGREKVVTRKWKEEEPAPPYSGFVGTPIDVPLRPIQAPQEDDEANRRNEGEHWFSRIWRMFDERRGYLAEVRKSPRYVPPGYSPDDLRPNEPDRGEFAYQFMLTQVAGYQGDVDRDFQTVRLEGKRGNSPETNVHIYDAHYSDLTKPQSTIVGFFFAFYQLLFHLAGLSLLAVYWAEAENRQKDPERQRRWRFKSSISATAVRLLTMVVPCLNLILLILGGTAFAEKVFRLAQPWRTGIAFAVAGVLVIVATFVLARRAPSPPRPFLWAMIPFLGPSLGVLVLSGLACLYRCFAAKGLPLWETLLVFCWLLFAGFALGWIAYKFNALRPGAFLLTLLLYGLSLLLFLGYLLPHAAGQQGQRSDVIGTAALWAVQWIFAALSLAWFSCLLAALISWFAGISCLRGVRQDESTAESEAAKAKKEAEGAPHNLNAAQALQKALGKVSDIQDRKARAIAAFRTGRFAFAVPTVLFLVVTTALWAGVIVSGSKNLGAFEGVNRNDVDQGLSNGCRHKWPTFIIPQIDPVQTWVAAARSGDKPTETKGVVDCMASAPFQPELPTSWPDYLEGLLLVSVTPALPITLGLFTIGLLLLTWAVLPSIVFEIKPEWTKDTRTNRLNWLGTWLSRGLDNTAILTRVLWFAIVPIPLLFFVIDWLALHTTLLDPWLPILYRASALTLHLIEPVGLALAVSGAALFSSILKGLTTVLDTILDVDNYLRTSPQDQTPRAKIAERCVSLLRYIGARRDEQNRPFYSKVIFVAHSLGSMVTTDLLRYLQRSARESPDPGLACYGFRGHIDPKCEPKIPIYVFSMGSPLRQLLNRFFPHLYWWVRDVPDNSLKDVGNPVQPTIPGIAATELPRSDEMNVKLWINAYRTGDYIGRSLWLGQWLTRNADDDARQPPDISKGGPPLACAEMCIGQGAHTHYWDRSAPDVAEMLDRLIV